MKVIRVVVEGLAPGLLMCSPQGMLIPREAGAKPGPKQRDLPLEEAAETLCYRMEDGAIGFPAVAFQRAGMEGGKGQSVKVGGKGSNKGLQGVLAGLWEVEPKDLVPLLRRGKPVKDYKIDIRTGLNNNTRPPARIVLARPLIEAPWQARFDILWDDVGGAPEVPDYIRFCLERAGRQVGVGGFRPFVQGKATGGWFGRFKIVEWETEA